jgi:hypothetical protein
MHRAVTCWGVAALLTACGPTAGGQSGSEFIDGSPDYGQVPQNGMCPCERFEGVVPLEAEVLSWESSVLSIEVKGTPIESLQKRAPARGTRLAGVYMGVLPCTRGTYAPRAGDRVLAYFFRASEPLLMCCKALQCPDKCEAEHQDDLEALDECTGVCQGDANAQCEAERERVNVPGYFELAPFDGQSAEFARAGERSLRVDTRDLPLVYESRAACAEIPDVRDVLADEDTRNEDSPWQRSCER